MNDLVALAVIAVIAFGLGIARWRFRARLPLAAVAVVDWAMSIIAALGLTIVVVTALELFLPSLPRFSLVAMYAVLYILVAEAIRSVQRQTSALVPGRDDEPDLEFPGLLPIAGPIGHTGHSTEPHLHFHLQDSADLFRGMGLPVRFLASAR